MLLTWAVLKNPAYYTFMIAHNCDIATPVMYQWPYWNHNYVDCADLHIDLHKFIMQSLISYHSIITSHGHHEIN